MKTDSKTILITGGAGFIGSNLAEKLLKMGHSVYIMDNLDDYYDPEIKKKNIEELCNYKNIKIFIIDINDKTTLSQIFHKHLNKLDLVIHLAAKAGVRQSIIDPIGYYKTNVLGTLNILEEMKRNCCKKMIFASSSSVYGNNKKIPFSEEDNVDYPISPYAATKKSGELICNTYHHLYGFDIISLRFFTVYGPRQRPDLAIHKFTKLIMEGKPIPFYGNGTTERDYTYIDDVIEGILGAVENLKGCDIFNIGGSKTISLAEMISVLEEILGKKAKLYRLPMQPGDVEKTFADITKARKFLKYNPKFSFEDGITEFIKWYTKSNQDLFI